MSRFQLADKCVFQEEIRGGVCSYRGAERANQNARRSIFLHATPMAGFLFNQGILL